MSLHLAYFIFLSLIEGGTPWPLSPAYAKNSSKTTTTSTQAIKTDKKSKGKKTKASVPPKSKTAEVYYIESGGSSLLLSKQHEPLPLKTVAATDSGSETERELAQKKLPIANFITITQKGKRLNVMKSDKKKELVEGDLTCITTDLKSIPTYITCGIVKKLNDGRLALGTSLEVEAMKGLKQLASVDSQAGNSEGTSEQTISSNFPSDWNVGAGFTAGNNYLFSQISFEHRVSPEITLGVMPLLSMASTADSKITAYGGFVTATYYFTRKESMTGLFGRAGVGVYAVRLKDSDTDETLSNWGGMMLGGYRGNLGKGFTALAGLGLQYLKKPNANSNKLTYEGLLPLLTAELGYRF